MRTPPRLILALDVPTAVQALSLVDQFEGRCDFYKVGLELFTAAGPSLIASLRARNVDVFLDLKLHDIPNTVRQAARQASAHDVRLLTVHASGGEAMLAAAVDGAGPGCGIMAVTVLTSLAPEELAAAWGRGPWIDVRAEVLRLATLADEAGAHGIVCSGAELEAVGEKFEGRLAPLVPGVRPLGAASNDQVRIVTPETATALGARYLVLGRAVTGAAAPLQAWDDIARSVAAVV